MKRAFMFCVVMFFAVAQAQAELAWDRLNAPGAVDTYPTAISGNYVVGYCQMPVIGINPEGPYGFIYDGTDWTILGLNIWPFGADGTKVTGYTTSGGFLYENGEYAEVNVPSEYGSGTHPWGISGNKIVGRYEDSASGHRRGFVHDYVENTWTTIDAFGSSYNTTLSGIDGTNMVGFYSLTSAYAYKSFFYDGQTYSTIEMPGATSTFANGISGNYIVGYYLDQESTVKGFLYDRISAGYSSLDLINGTDVIAYDVDGESVVGTVNDPEGFVLDVSTVNIPEPSSLLLIVSAGIIFIARLLRRK